VKADIERVALKGAGHSVQGILRTPVPNKGRREQVWKRAPNPPVASVDAPLNPSTRRKS
jgi:hypothetical protein